jgi:hypothetical protein
MNLSLNSRDSYLRANPLVSTDNRTHAGLGIIFFTIGYEYLKEELLNTEYRGGVVISLESEEAKLPFS